VKTPKNYAPRQPDKVVAVKWAGTEQHMRDIVEWMDDGVVGFEFLPRPGRRPMFFFRNRYGLLYHVHPGDYGVQREDGVFVRQQGASFESSYKAVSEVSEPDAPDLVRLMEEFGGTPLATDPTRTYHDVWVAPGTAAWRNKPHRVLYDALQEALYWRRLATNALRGRYDLPGGPF